MGKGFARVIVAGVMLASTGLGQGVDPHATVRDPHASGGDPHAAVRDPRASGADRHASGADPHAGGADPHAGGSDPHAGKGGGPQVFEPPADTADEAPALPAGSISVELRDADDRPVKGVVTIGILRNSVAKGESRERMARDTDANGSLRLDGLDTDSTVAYRISSAKDGATFAVMPFRLPADKGMRVVLHVYPVTTSLEQAVVVSQGIVVVELKDDRIQIHQGLTIFNFGRTAWLPHDVILPLPSGFTALTGQQGMSDVGIDPVEGKGARLRGTIGPGRHDVEMRWQLPFSGEKDTSLVAPLPPHTAAIRVISPASKGVRVEVPGFPAPTAKTDGQGGRVLVTEKQLRREEGAVTSVTVELHDLPTPGPGRVVATLLAVLGVAAGLFMGRGRTSTSNARPLRASILEDLETLERAFRASTIGPRTYESEKRLLLDQLATTYVQKS